MEDFDGSVDYTDSFDDSSSEVIESGETSDDITTEEAEIEISNEEQNEVVENQETEEVEEEQEVQETEKTEETEEMSREELQEYLEKESPYSSEVNEYISSKEELQVYKDAGLVEQNIDGRTCLVRENIDPEYVDKNSGLTNAELMAKGRSPYDAETGEKIELHHIGQDFNAPLAELTSRTEHDLNTKVLHKSETDSWRRDEGKVSEYNSQRKAHWKGRV